jgi:protein-disulfide isomerase
MFQSKERPPQDPGERAYCEWKAEGGAFADTYEIKVFSDYECPACQKNGRILEDYKGDHSSRFKLTVVHYPLDVSCNQALLRPLHANACAAAQYVLCAGALDLAAYWQVHKAFLQLHKFDRTSLNRAINELGLNEAAISNCVYTGKAKARLAADIDQGMKLGVNETPTIYINGTKLTALEPVMLERFLDILLEMDTDFECPEQKS